MIKSLKPDSVLGKFVLSGESYDTLAVRDEDIPEEKRKWHEEIKKAFKAIRDGFGYGYDNIAYKVGDYWASYYVVRIGNQWYYTQDRDRSASRSCPAFKFYKCDAPTIFESMSFGQHGTLQRRIIAPWTYCSEELPRENGTYLVSALKDDGSQEPLKRSIMAEWKDGSWITSVPTGDIYAWRDFCQTAPYMEG